MKPTQTHSSSHDPAPWMLGTSIPGLRCYLETLRIELARRPSDFWYRGEIDRTEKAIEIQRAMQPPIGR